jgi:hypothetical protein
MMAAGSMRQLLSVQQGSLTTGQHQGTGTLQQRFDQIRGTGDARMTSQGAVG